MATHQDAPIGVFDSGVGGLTVTRALVDRLPRESILYFGDTARVPYGNKSPETIRRYGLNVTAHLRAAGVKAIVVACNTASAFSLDAIRLAGDRLVGDIPAGDQLAGDRLDGDRLDGDRLDGDIPAGSIPVLGVIEPVARIAALRSASRSIGVIGTRGTVTSGAYTRALLALDPGLTVQAHPCPLFVPLAEEGWLKGSVPREIARSYLAPFADTDVDTLILGCTHYPLLREVIQAAIDEIVGRPILVLDSALATAAELHDLLDAQGLLRPAEGGPEPVHRCLVTDSVAAFHPIAERFFGAPLGRVEHVDL